MLIDHGRRSLFHLVARNHLDPQDQSRDLSAASLVFLHRVDLDLLEASHLCRDRDTRTSLQRSLEQSLLAHGVVHQTVPWDHVAVLDPVASDWGCHCFEEQEGHN
jgi:hypothetical protein